MNTLISNTLENPHGAEDVCAQFDIDDIATPFTMHDVAVVGQDYTLGFWIKSAAAGSINVGGETIQSTTAWTRHVVKFTATNSALGITFNSVGTYYIYNIKLEDGNKDTSWTPSPDDMATGVDVVNAQTTAEEAQIAAGNAQDSVDQANSEVLQLADTISSLVESGSKASIITQTASGWAFDMSTYDKTIAEMVKKTERITIGQYKYIDKNGTEQTVPCIELSESDSEFKVRITNQAIHFVSGNDTPAFIENNGDDSRLMIEQAEVINELQQGGFVWKKRENGNLGLMWKGG